MEDELNEQNGEWDKLLEFLTTEVLYRVCDGKYDPDNDEAPEFHPGSKRNKKCEIKKYLSDQLDKMDFECEEGKIFRELVLEMDTSNRRKRLVYRQQGRKIKELEKVIQYHPEKMQSLEELLEVKTEELKEKYEEKLAFGERNRQRANKQMERINQLNAVLEDYRQNYVLREEYNELRDTYNIDMLNAKEDVKRAKEKAERREDRLQDAAERQRGEDKDRKKKEKKKREKIMKEKKKKMEELEKELEEEQNKLDFLNESCDSDSDEEVETLHYSVGSDSESD